MIACVLRDDVQRLLGPLVDAKEPLYTLPETERAARLTTAKGRAAGDAVRLVYRRLRNLPSRGQAAAPWAAGQLPRREFDTLYRDVAELCRTLGAELPEVVGP